jgi:hypothetical protein
VRPIAPFTSTCSRKVLWTSIDELHSVRFCDFFFSWTFGSGVASLSPAALTVVVAVAVHRSNASFHGTHRSPPRVVFLPPL